MSVRLRVDGDGRVAGQVPVAVPAGEHVASLEVTDATPPPEAPPRPPLTPELPPHGNPRPDGLRVSREEIHDDDGR